MPKRGKNWKPPAQRRPTAPAGTPPTSREERRLEAERRREAIRRAAIRRRRLRTTAIVAGVLVVGGAVTGYVLTRPTPVSAEVQERRLLAAAPAATDSAGCGKVETIKPYDGGGDIDHQHVTTIPPLSTYPSTPPVSGPHAPIPPGPMPAGIYDSPPDIARMIHSLEHAAVIVWYSPSVADSQEIGRIKDFFSKSEEEFKVLVAPYQYDQQGGTLPEGKTIALAAWHHLQFCDSPSLAVAYQFVYHYRFDPSHPGQYKGDAREPTAGL